MARLNDIFASGAGGAGTGAAIGSIIPGVGTGIGAAVGGGLGLLSSLFGGGDKRRRRNRQQVQRAQGLLDEETERTRALHNLLSGRVDTLTNTPITSSATYQAGRGALHNLLGDVAQSDASSAAARGLSGGELEIAQGANRQRSAVGGLRGLLGQAESAQRSERLATLSQLLGTQGALHNLVGTQAQLATGQQARGDAQRQANQQAIAQAVMNALLATQ